MTSIKTIAKSLTTILTNLNNFRSLEVVDRVSEAQLQVGENFNQIAWRLEGYTSESDVYIRQIMMSNEAARVEWVRR